MYKNINQPVWTKQLGCASVERDIVYIHAVLL